jgi:hypothetical protein
MESFQKGSLGKSFPAPGGLLGVRGDKFLGWAVQGRSPNPGRHPGTEECEGNAYCPAPLSILLATLIPLKPLTYLAMP